MRACRNLFSSCTILAKKKHRFNVRLESKRGDVNVWGDHLCNLSGSETLCVFIFSSRKYITDNTCTKTYFQFKVHCGAYFGYNFAKLEALRLAFNTSYHKDKMFCIFYIFSFWERFTRAISLHNTVGFLSVYSLRLPTRINAVIKVWLICGLLLSDRLPWWLQTLSATPCKTTHWALWAYPQIVWLSCQNL